MDEYAENQQRRIFFNKSRQAWNAVLKRHKNTHAWKVLLKPQRR